MFKLFFSYWRWHYSEGVKELLKLERNFIFFIFHFFAIKELVSTLFLPWQLLGEKYRGGFDLKEWFSSLVINVLMRFVGFFMRSILIILGIVFGLMFFCISVILIILWLILPFILSMILYGALKQIF